MKKETTTVEVYLVLFKSKDEEMLVACGDIYDHLSYSFMKSGCEYKDLSESALKEGWTLEKKVKEVSF
jgi:hypothetical protein